jgi:KUP system potassium uptake protein
MVRSNIVYERNIFISIVTTDEPFGVKTHLQSNIGTGLDSFEIKVGYTEVIDIETLLKMNGIREKVIFYGIEDISTKNPLWRVFSLLKTLTPNFVQFHKLPASKLQGVVTRVEM